MQGIPDNIQQERQQPAQTAAPTEAAPAAQGQTQGGADDVNLFDLAAQRGGRGAGAGAGAGASAADLGNLDFLRGNPQFQQLRQVVQQQPQMLEPILQQLGAGNPQLAQLIASNPDAFLSLLGEDAEDDVPLPPGAQAISVTEEERDAIERVSFVCCTRHLSSYANPATVMSSRIRPRSGYPGLLRLRQERRAGCQLPV